MYWGISVAVLLHMNFKGGGGHHQVRAALALAAEDSSDEESSISPMENGLLYRWAWGRIHATDVQSLAYDAFLEGLDQPKIMKLASLGAFWPKSATHSQANRADRVEAHQHAARAELERASNQSYCRSGRAHCCRVWLYQYARLGLALVSLLSRRLPAHFQCGWISCVLA